MLAGIHRFICATEQIFVKAFIKQHTIDFSYVVDTTGYKEANKQIRLTGWRKCVTCALKKTDCIIKDQVSLKHKAQGLLISLVGTFLS